ncbi:unnamed protein product [Paramecium pentaurelia]|uniref:Uncharacterized protein n=1 Tax=Paramecium pentaurelia TaxID=43138 RepID=A0A8S1W5W7_9CILI|nr:unnamed protein product [Paramecium pentaurelia]
MIQQIYSSKSNSYSQQKRQERRNMDRLKSKSQRYFKAAYIETSEN